MHAVDSKEQLRGAPRTADYIVNVLGPIAAEVITQVEKTREITMSALRAMVDMENQKASGLVQATAGQGARPIYIESTITAFRICGADESRCVNVDAAVDTENFYLMNSNACLLEARFKFKKIIDFPLASQVMNTLSLEDASFLTACACAHLDQTAFCDFLESGAAVESMKLARTDVNDVNNEYEEVPPEELREYLYPEECKTKSRPRP